MTPQQEASFREVSAKVGEISAAVGDLAGVVNTHGDLLGESSEGVKAIAVKVEEGAKAVEAAADAASEGGLDTMEIIGLSVAALATLLFGPQIGGVVSNLTKVGLGMVATGAKKVSTAATVGPAKKK